MTRIASKIASFFTGSLEGSLSASSIKDFVLKKYDRLINEPLKGGGVDRELIELKTNMACLGWNGLEEPVQSEKKKNDEDERSNVYKWFNNLKNNRIIDQGIIANDAGANLDWLDEKNEDLNGFTSMALESILRIVEVKRKKILKAFSRELTGDEEDREGLRISILLSRTSRRHDDLRYLNAALKLNNWYYPIFRSVTSGRTLLFYLLALTEQEKSAAEILR